MLKFIRIFLLILIILGVVALATQKSWVPRLVEYILSNENTPAVMSPAENEQQTKEDEYVSYKSSEYSPEFVYPKSWGDVVIKKGNDVCPEEDTYRTLDTLSVFDWELSFAEMKLPNSDSMIRTGVRLYELDPKNLNNCGDEFLLKLAQGEIDPRIISSVMLQPITIGSGLKGIYTAEASRLNTESRRQYTFLINEGSIVYVLQSYMSFIPYFGSKELKEMEVKFTGDMQRYLEEGASAENIRNKFKGFKVMSESLKFRL